MENSENIDIHEIYNSIRCHRDQKESRYEEIAKCIIKKVRERLQTHDFTLADDSTLGMEVKWKWNANKKEQFDAQILTRKLTEKLKPYTIQISTYPISNRRQSWDLFLLTDAASYQGGFSGFFMKMLAIPADILLVPVFVLHNAVNVARNRLSSKYYNTSLHISIPSQILASIHDAQPGGKEFLNAKTHFETNALQQ